MQAVERPADVSISFVTSSLLPPTTLFDLLADPRGCATWHEHPKGCDVDEVDAPPGPALEGAEFRMRGHLRGVPYRIRTVVTAAQRPRVYATLGEQVFEHPRAILTQQTYTEQFTIDPDPSGSVITYRTQIWRLWKTGVMVALLRPPQWLIDKASAAGQQRRAIQILLGSAERRAGARS